MAIYRLLQESSPAEESRRLAAAYEQTLQALALVDRNDPITELVARKIIEIGRSGIRDPKEISRIAAKQLGARCRVLVVEDEYFLAKDLEAALKSLGAEVVALIGDLNEAMDRIKLGGFEFVILDVNLHGHHAFGLADELQRFGVPFVFTTGYGAHTVPARFADVIRWEKPFEPMRVAQDVMKIWAGWSSAPGRDDLR